LSRHFRLDQAGAVLAFQFQACGRSDKQRTYQLYADARLPGAVAVDIELVRTHEADRGRILCRIVFGRLECNALAHVQPAPVGTAVEEIDVAEEAVDERRRG